MYEGPRCGTSGNTLCGNTKDKININFIPDKMPIVSRCVIDKMKRHLRESNDKLQHAIRLLDSKTTVSNYLLIKITNEIDNEHTSIKRIILNQLKPRRQVKEFDDWFHYVTGDCGDYSPKSSGLLTTKVSSAKKSRPKYSMPKSPQTKQKKPIVTNLKRLPKRLTEKNIKSLNEVLVTSKMSLHSADLCLSYRTLTSAYSGDECLTGVIIPTYRIDPNATSPKSTDGFNHKKHTGQIIVHSDTDLLRVSRNSSTVRINESHHQHQHQQHHHHHHIEADDEDDENGTHTKRTVKKVSIETPNQRIMIPSSSRCSNNNTKRFKSFDSNKIDSVVHQKVSKEVIASPKRPKVEFYTDHLRESKNEFNMKSVTVDHHRQHQSDDVRQLNKTRKDYGDVLALNLTTDDCIMTERTCTLKTAQTPVFKLERKEPMKSTKTTDELSDISIHHTTTFVKNDDSGIYLDASDSSKIYKNIGHRDSFTKQIKPQRPVSHKGRHQSTPKRRKLSLKMYDSQFKVKPKGDQKLVKKQINDKLVVK